MTACRPLTVSVLKAVGVALGYFVLGRLAFASCVTHDIVTPVVFGAEGVALAAALRWGGAAAPGVFLGQFCLAHSMGLSLIPTLAVSCVNAAECLLAGWYGRRTDLDAGLTRLRDVLLLMGGSVCLLQPISACLGVGALWATGGVPADQVPLSWFSWWMGNFLGQCIVAPALLVLLTPLRTWWPGPLLATLGLVTVGLLAFGSFGGPAMPSFALALAFWFPVAVLVAVLFGVEGSALGGLGICAVAIFVTSQGRGPFLASWVELDLFLAGNLTVLALGALFTERRRLEGALRDQNAALGRANQDLSTALAEVQTLEGLLPICAWCKQVRDDDGYWNSLEEHFSRRSQVSFSHGICPSCYRSQWREVADGHEG